MRRALAVRFFCRFSRRPQRSLAFTSRTRLLAFRLPSSANTPQCRSFSAQTTVAGVIDRDKAHEWASSTYREMAGVHIEERTAQLYQLKERIGVLRLTMKETENELQKLEAEKRMRSQKSIEMAQMQLYAASEELRSEQSQELWREETRLSRAVDEKRAQLSALKREFDATVDQLTQAFSQFLSSDRLYREMWRRLTMGWYVFYALLGLGLSGIYRRHVSRTVHMSVQSALEATNAQTVDVINETTAVLLAANRPLAAATQVTTDEECDSVVENTVNGPEMVDGFADERKSKLLAMGQKREMDRIFTENDAIEIEEEDSGEKSVGMSLSQFQETVLVSSLTAMVSVGTYVMLEFLISSK